MYTKIDENDDYVFVVDENNKLEVLTQEEYLEEESKKYEEELLKEYEAEKINETWSPIKDFEGLYSVSNLGRVKNDRTGKVLKGHSNPYAPWIDNYTLYKNGKRYNYSHYNEEFECWFPEPKPTPRDPNNPFI